MSCTKSDLDVRQVLRNTGIKRHMRSRLPMTAVCAVSHLADYSVRARSRGATDLGQYLLEKHHGPMRLASRTRMGCEWGSVRAGTGGRHSAVQPGTVAL